MRPESAQNLSSEMQIEAIELASNFILQDRAAQSQGA